jgi:hypothetical protein
MHRKTDDFWMERKELVTDDLHRMFWEKLEKRGTFIPTNQVTAEWVDHLYQLHKIIQEPEGGINTYRSFFHVQHPLRFHTTVGNYIDEVAYFEPFRHRPTVSKSENTLKILLVGELAYNSERIYALEEQGHKLYGLWMKDPYWYNTVGPLPFGHVEDIPHENWHESIKKIQPDIIYALLNWQAVPFVHEVLTKNPGVPFVWHFKEGPFICREKGTWKQLIDIYKKSDGNIFITPEMRDWFFEFLPEIREKETMILDGDLPKKEWFTDDRSPLLSQKDGEIHTVIPGRPIGLHPETVVDLAKQRIHVHFYGDFTHGQWKAWIEKTMQLAPAYLHVHPNVDQRKWVQEFSQYDAGWLHFFQSENNGDLVHANWDDLNLPARIGTYACAGLPMIQKNNKGHIVATQSLGQKLNLSIFFDSIDELAQKLSDKTTIQIRESVWNQREQFSFDYHVPALIQFFRTVINKKVEQTP